MKQHGGSAKAENEDGLKIILTFPKGENDMTAGEQNDRQTGACDTEAKIRKNPAGQLQLCGILFHISETKQEHSVNKQKVG